MAKLIFCLRILLRIVRGDRLLFLHLHLTKCLRWLPKPRIYDVMMHGMEIDMDEANRFQRILENAHNVICNSKRTQQTVQSKYSLQNTIQCYYPPNEFALSASGDQAAKSSRPTALMVGRMSRFERYKGHDLVLESWQKLTQSMPDALLVVVGDGDDRQRLQQKAVDLELAENVEFNGLISDQELARRYQQTWIFVLPSQNEGQGLVYLEAMQFGLPVIALENTTAVEFVNHGENGCLINERSSAKLASSMEAILKDAETRNRMGRASAQIYEALDVVSAFDRTMVRLMEEGV